ncbi:MAG: hypothetical protein Q4B17_05870 [Lautropia sp.]|nr:hypothetical protein [Lautropia sp.]
MKEDWHERMKRCLVGRQWPLEEGARRSLDEGLANAAVVVYYLVATLMVISLLVDVYTHRKVSVSFGTVALMVVHVFLSCRVIRASKQAGLSGAETLSPSNHARTVRTMKRSAWLLGLGWGASMTVLMNVVLPWVAGQPVKQDLFHWVIWWVGGAVMGAFFYRDGKRLVKASCDDREC